jgi:4-hydroxy-tetrahydrodipicolinate reductase
MGQETLRALVKEPDMEPVGAVARTEQGDNRLPLPVGADSILYSTDLEDLLEVIRPHVVVDFSNKASVLGVARTCAEHRVHLVTGTSGLSPEEIGQMGRLASDAGVGVMVGPNFSLGAVLLTYLAKKVANYFDYAEIIEMHHATKADAPSGNAVATARALTEARGEGNRFARPEPHLEPLKGSRGAALDGVSIHAVRMPGLMAHQQLIFGGPGETLTLRHDTINRECYMPGVMLAVRKVRNTVGLTYGLDAFLGLD